MKTVMKEVLTFTPDDIYVLRYLNRRQNGGWDEWEVTVIGEENAHHQFDFVCKNASHERAELCKGKIMKHLNGCVLSDTVIRSWEKGDA